MASAPRPTPKAAPKVRGPGWYLAIGLVTLALGAVNVVIQSGLRRFTAAAGVLLGLSFVAKSLRRLAEQGAPPAPSRVGDDPSLSIWQAPWRSFYSSRFYDDVGRRGPGLGLTYLLTLEAVTWFVSMAMGYTAFLGFLSTDGQRLIAQVPRIEIRDGKAQIKAPQPYYIRVGQGKDVFSIALDTTGEVTSLEGRPDLGLLLTETKLHSRQSSGQIRIHDFSSTKSLDLDQAILQGWVDRYTEPVFAVVYALAVLAAFSYRLVQALLYAGIGLGFASMFRKALSYGASLRLSIAAVTPVILLDSILGWTGVSQASGFLWWGVCVAAALGLLAFGVKSLEEV